jgi:3',5'-cyclic AMP phosphodiesterase CpdA
MIDAVDRDQFTSLVHVSDLHFGANCPVAAAALQDAIARLEPSVVVVTGDLTQYGRRREFAAAADFIKSLAAPLVAIPGNHDAPVFDPFERFVSPWRRFRSATGCALDVTHTDQSLLLVALNSARRAGPSFDWSLGRLTSGQVDTATAALRQAPQSQLRVVALHHPVIASTGRAGAAVIPNAARIMGALCDAGAEVILTGHAHRSGAVAAPRTDGLIVVSAGTALSTRTRGEPPSFNLVRWHEARIDVDVFDYDGAKFTPQRQFKFQRKLNMAGNAQIAPSSH